MTPKIFRLLLLGSIVFALIGGLADYLWSPVVEPATDELSTYEVIALAAGFLYFLLIVVCLVGLLRWAGWSRFLLLILTICSFFITASLGVLQTEGVAQAFYDLSMVLTGALVASAYWSPVSSKFEADGSP